MSDNVTLFIDGRRVEAPRGSYLLQAARTIGIDIPALCDHSELEPVAACRLCMVEVTHPDWDGWSGLMTSCIYPVAEGLRVSTRSERVLQARAGVLALLAARCPGSALIQDMARRYGARPAELGLRVDPEADTCILCGLCARVCASYATAAIATTSRGSSKRIAAFAGEPPAECVGCGACARVCPTGTVAARWSGGRYTIWERAFDALPATVEESRCLGCGACEEACPFSVVRLVLRASGERIATIAREHCRGCGACVAACPSGAVDQAGGSSWADLTRRLAGGQP
jgi:bidirectional [NiFe] hydrogenase diaphorase subunit